MSRLTNEFFSDSYLMPTKLDGFRFGCMGTENVEEVKGIIELKDTDRRITLENIAEALHIKNVVSDRACSTYFAIPSPMANVISFENLVRRALRTYVDKGIGVLKNMEQEKRALNEWLGILSLWTSQSVLKAYGINISTEIITLSDENKPLHRILSASMKDIPVFEKAKNSSGQYQIMVIKQDNVPFAIFHPQLLLCPFRQYPVELFKGKIQWYDCEKDRNDAHNCWLDMVGQMEAGESFMPDFVLDRLILWAYRNRQKSGDSDLMHCLLQMINPEEVRKRNELSARLKTSKELLSTQNMLAYMDQLVDGKGAGKNFMTMDGQLELPDVFLPQIMLVNIGSKDSPGYETFMMRDKRLCRLEYERNMMTSEALDSVVPLLPCGFQTMGKLEEMGLEITAARFLVKLAETKETDRGEIERIRVTITLRKKEEEQESTYEIIHTYYSQQIVTGVLPFVAVWPYVSLPADTWKNYYGCSALQMDGKIVTALIPHQAVLSGRENEGYLTQLPEVRKITAQFPYATECSCEDFQEGRYHSEWKMAHSEVMFRYVSFQSNGREMGSIQIPECDEFNVDKMKRGEIYRIGVDLGTTSTLCGCMPVDEKGVSKEKEKMMVINNDARTITYVSDTDLMAFVKSWWLPQYIGKEGMQGKFLTISQLFQSEWHGTAEFAYRPYINGRICFMDSRLLKDLTQGNEENERDALAELRIFNNMKESEENTDNEQGKATRIFMTNLLMFGVLEGLKKGFYRFELRCSYPSKGYLSRLSGMWQNAVNNIRDYIVEAPEKGAEFPFSFDRNIYFFTEAKSVMSYQRNVERNNVNNYIIVDIGGGTTDISLIGNSGSGVKNMKVDSEVSLKYAGRRLVNDSIVECLRFGTERQRNAPVSPLTGIWMANERIPNPKKPGKESKKLDASAETLVERFELDAGSVDPEKSEAVTAYMELVEKNTTVREIIEVLLDKVGIRDYLQDEKYYVLRSIIAFKYYMLFYVIAKYIRNNFDAIVFQADKSKQVNIFIAGTGAKGLEIVMGRKLGDLNSSPVIKSIKNMILDVLGEDDIILNFTVSPEVEKKKEVCLGMLHLRQEDGAVINELNQQEEEADLTVKESVRNMTIEMVDGFDTDTGHEEITDFVKLMAEYLKNYDHDAGIMQPQDDDCFKMTNPQGKIQKLKDAVTTADLGLLEAAEITSMINNLSADDRILESLEELDDAEGTKSEMARLMTKVYIVDTAINRIIAKAQIETRKKKN